MKKKLSSFKMDLKFQKAELMEEKMDAKSVSEKAKGYFGQGYN